MIFKTNKKLIRIYEKGFSTTKIDIRSGCQNFILCQLILSLFLGTGGFREKNTLIYLNIEPKCRTGYYFLFLNLKIRKEIFQFSTRNQPQIPETLNSQAPELYRGLRARCARSGENGEGEVRSL